MCEIAKLHGYTCYLYLYLLVIERDMQAQKTEAFDC